MSAARNAGMWNQPIVADAMTATPPSGTVAAIATSIVSLSHLAGKVHILLDGIRASTEPKAVHFEPLFSGSAASLPNANSRRLAADVRPDEVPSRHRLVGSNFTTMHPNGSHLYDEVGEHSS